MEILLIWIIIILIIGAFIYPWSPQKKEFDFDHPENNTPEENQKFTRILKQTGGCATEAIARMRPNDRVARVI